MRRSLNIFLWILVGALAAGGSVGYFLHAANQDRRVLAEQAYRAEQRAEAEKLASARLATEANAKLQDASSQIQLAKKELSTYHEYAANLAKASLLPRPSPHFSRTWNQTMSLSLGISLLVPSTSYTTETQDRLTVLRTGMTDESLWMTIIPYDETRERAWQDSVTGTAPLLYTFDRQHLLQGVRGSRLDNQETVYLFHIQNPSTSTHLLWIEPRRSVTESEILQTLSTLSMSP